MGSIISCCEESHGCIVVDVNKKPYSSMSLDPHSEMVKMFTDKQLVVKCRSYQCVSEPIIVEQITESYKFDGVSTTSCEDLRYSEM